MKSLNHKNREEYIRTMLNALNINDLKTFREHFLALHPTEQIDIFTSLNKNQRQKLYGFISAEEFADIFQGLELDQQKQTINEVDQGYAVNMFYHMYADDVADFIGQLDAKQKEHFLGKMSPEDQEDVLDLLAYPEDSAGSIMTTEFISLSTKDTVAAVMDRLKKEAPDAETIYYLYVVDEYKKLVGVVSLRDLIVASDDQNIGDLMSSRVVSVSVTDDQENVAEVIKKYDFLAVPVVSKQGKLVGIVTVDDVLDVTEVEATEDFHKMAPIVNLGKNIKNAGTFFLYRKRIPWLVALVFMNIFSGAGIAFFEDTIAAHIALVFFLPLLVDSGGNAGSQSATLMIRALATGDIRLRDWGRLFAKEIAVASLIGLTMAIAVSGIGIFRGGMDIAAVVSLTMVLVVIVGSLIGMSLPFLLSKFKMDPATASAPLITSLADITGVLIFFSIATWYLAI
jgi:magnesium transporter